MMNEIVLKILAQIALNQGDIPNLIKQLQSEVAKAAGVEIPIKFQKPPSDASIRSLIQRSREEFALQGIKKPSNADLLQQLEAQAARQGLLEKFPPEQIRSLGERQLQLEALGGPQKEEDRQFRTMLLEEKLAKQREEQLFRTMLLEEKLAKLREDKIFRTMQLEEKSAKQKEDKAFRTMLLEEKIAKAGLGRSDISKLLESVSNEMKSRRMGEMEQAVARGRKYEFDPAAMENRQEALNAARAQLGADPRFAGNARKTSQAMAQFEEQMNLRRMRSLEFLAKTAGQTNFQISATANYLLAASSILRPLSPALSNLAMSAGFAAFSLGPVPAVLTAVSAGLGAWINLLKTSSAEATKAGMATLEWREATFQYNTTLQALLITIGRDVQREFAPVVDIFEEIVFELGNWPWQDFLKSTAEGAEALARITLAFVEMAGPALELANKLKLDEFVLSKPMMDSLAILADMFTGGPSRTDLDRPQYTPPSQFRITDVRDVGSSIQQSLLKNTVEDQILAETVKANEQRNETNKILREGLLNMIYPNAKIRNPFAATPEIVTGEAM